MAKPKARMVISTTMMTSGIIMRRTEIPPAFIATSSYFSPKLPIVIMDANKVAMGRAIGTKVMAA